MDGERFANCVAPGCFQARGSRGACTAFDVLFRIGRESRQVMQMAAGMTALRLGRVRWNNNAGQPMIASNPAIPANEVDEPGARCIKRVLLPLRVAYRSWISGNRCRAWCRPRSGAVCGTLVLKAIPDMPSAEMVCC